MTVQDKYELINNIDKPSIDNEVRIQILPKFDNAYKKINLTFYISNIQVNGNSVRLTCIYKLPKLLSSQYKSFGEIDTYNLFKTTAIDTDLGFASNISELTDNRFIYCDNKSLLDLMKSEIDYSNANEYILDWWVDLWNNINLVDIKERYNTIDSDDDLMIWVAGNVDEVGKDIEIKPNKVVASLNNHPGLINSELYVQSYKINSTPGTSVSMGTDKVYGIYENINSEYSDFFVQDGDIKRDIFSHYEYVGENYGEYNYLLSKFLRKGYLQKINSETISVTLKSPLLAIMRGHKVNFIKYVNDSNIENRLSKLEDEGVISRDMDTNIPMSNYEINVPTDNGKFSIDKTVSGQYLILNVTIMYTNNAWEYKLTLARPADSKTSIVNE
jgi:hypothetical protein